MATQEKKSLEMEQKTPSRASSDIEKQPLDVEQTPPQENPPTQVKDVNQISWDSDTDQDNPMNWPPARVWKNLGIISVMTFSTYANHFPFPPFSFSHRPLLLKC